MKVVVRKRSFMARLLRFPGTVRAHYRITRNLPLAFRLASLILK